MSPINPDKQLEVITQDRAEVKEPPMYRVLLHNDDYTTKEFVVSVLMAVFGKHMDEAVQLMMHVHKNGTGLCGTYTYEMAETKVTTVTHLARENGFPLKVTLEEA